ncbi:MAG: hypothetical protein MHM6MM_000031 [Cercozoa sp. M6MM]
MGVLRYAALALATTCAAGPDFEFRSGGLLPCYTTTRSEIKSAAEKAYVPLELDLSYSAELSKNTTSAVISVQAPGSIGGGNFSSFRVFNNTGENHLPIPPRQTALSADEFEGMPRVHNSSNYVIYLNATDIERIRRFAMLSNETSERDETGRHWTPVDLVLSAENNSTHTVQQQTASVRVETHCRFARPHDADVPEAGLRVLGPTGGFIFDSCYGQNSTDLATIVVEPALENDKYFHQVEVSFEGNSLLNVSGYGSTPRVQVPLSPNLKTSLLKSKEVPFNVSVFLYDNVTAFELGDRDSSRLRLQQLIAVRHNNNTVTRAEVLRHLPDQSVFYLPGYELYYSQAQQLHISHRNDDIYVKSYGRSASFDFGGVASFSNLPGCSPELLSRHSAVYFDKFGDQIVPTGIDLPLKIGNLVPLLRTSPVAVESLLRAMAGEFLQPLTEVVAHVTLSQEESEALESTCAECCISRAVLSLSRVPTMIQANFTLIGAKCPFNGQVIHEPSLSVSVRTDVHATSPGTRALRLQQAGYVHGHRSLDIILDRLSFEFAPAALKHGKVLASVVGPAGFSQRVALSLSPSEPCPTYYNNVPESMRTFLAELCGDDVNNLPMRPDTPDTHDGAAHRDRVTIVATVLLVTAYTVLAAVL